MSFKTTNILSYHDNWIRVACSKNESKPILVRRDCILAIKPMYEVKYTEQESGEELPIEVEVGAYIVIENGEIIETCHMVAEIEKVLVNQS